MEKANICHQIQVSSYVHIYHQKFRTLKEYRPIVDLMSCHSNFDPDNDWNNLSQSTLMFVSRRNAGCLPAAVPFLSGALTFYSFSTGQFLRRYDNSPRLCRTAENPFRISQPITTLGTRGGTSASVDTYDLTEYLVGFDQVHTNCGHPATTRTNLKCANSDEQTCASDL